MYNADSADRGPDRVALPITDRTQSVIYEDNCRRVWSA